jgi:cell division protein FtsQ
MRDEGKAITARRQYPYTSHRSRKVKVAAPEQEWHKSWFVKTCCGLLLLIFLLAGWSKLTNPRTFPICAVQITGNYGHVDHEALRQVVLPFLKSGFIWIDATGLHDRLLQLPWVYSVSVKRHWPDKLQIQITEQQPIARFNDMALINNQGDVFSVNANTTPPGLPVFYGPIGSQQLMLATYQQILTTLAPLNARIASLSLDTRQSWQLQLDNGMLVILGKTDPLARLQRFVAVYPQMIGNRAANVLSADLRYPNGIAVQFKDEAQAT